MESFQDQAELAVPVKSSVIDCVKKDRRQFTIYLDERRYFLADPHYADILAD